MDARIELYGPAPAGHNGDWDEVRCGTHRVLLPVYTYGQCRSYIDGTEDVEAARGRGVPDDVLRAMVGAFVARNVKNPPASAVETLARGGCVWTCYPHPGGG